MSVLNLIIIACFALGAFAGIAFLIVSKLYVKPGQGEVLIVNKASSGSVATFEGALVMPIVHRAELMSTRVHTIEIRRHGRDGLICRDSIRADLDATFFVRVNPVPEDILRVAQAIGVARAGETAVLEQLFVAKFAEALKTVAAQQEFRELVMNRAEFRDRVLDMVGQDLNGFVVDDLSIEQLEQTPIEALDPNNIMDAEGIRKIRAMTSGELARE